MLAKHQEIIEELAFPYKASNAYRALLISGYKHVVHGDPNPRNILMTADRVALIDWDESHVDVPDLDLVLPHNAAGLDGGAHDIAAQASAAWEAAVCWDDAYAIKRLAQVRAV
jgi:aminoglycoside phosphotransferase (APT) family kinase protein